MESYELAKESLVKRLKKEIEILSEVDNSSTITVDVHGTPMEFDSEILLKEKKEELKNVETYYERLLETTSELIENEKMVEALLAETEDYVDLYLKGIKFTFNRRCLLEKLEKEKQSILSERREIKEYFKTGKLIL